MSDLKSLGYITISTNDIHRWRQFAFGVLGFAEGKGPDSSALYLRMDERAARMIVVPGMPPGAHRRLGGARSSRIAASQGSPRRCRGAVQTALDRRGRGPSGGRGDRLRGPAGTTLEVFHGAVLDHSPVITPFGAAFVTADQGLGHVVLPATDPNGLFDFYTEVLGFRSRGAFRVPLPKEFGPVRVRFLGINERPQLGRRPGRTPA